MKNIEKKEAEPFKEFCYQRVINAPSWKLAYNFIVLMNIYLDFFILFRQVDPDLSANLAINDKSLMYFSSSLLALFFLFTLLSFWKDFAKGLWMYTLVLLEASGSLFIKNVGQCLSDEQWCASDQNSIMISCLMLFLYALIVVLIIPHAYYPFSSLHNVFALKQEYMPVYHFLARVSLGVVTYHQLFSDPGIQVKALLLIACCLFLKSRTNGFVNPSNKTIWGIYYIFIVWSYFIIFVSFYRESLQNIGSVGQSLASFSRGKAFWSMWGYTIPFVILVPVFQSKIIDDHSWLKLFTSTDHQLSISGDKQTVFLILNQYEEKIAEVSKCEMKYKGNKFRQLWNFIKVHNQSCLQIDCPLKELEFIKKQSDDDFLQQQRFSKTLQASLDYGRAIMQKMRESSPNDFTLNLEICCFQLYALKNKQKGMKLIQEIKEYDKETKQDAENKNELESKQQKNTKAKNSKFKNITFSHRYGIYFLKKQIDDIYVGQERVVQSNMENEISQFRQKVEISVTMLGQFWSFLADHKCNLKKLYDLTSVLFPLKVSVEKDWERVNQFKNIESFNLYAKYLIKMFNDKEKGAKILSQAKKIEQEQRNKDGIDINNKSVDIVDENGVIFLEFDGKNPGVIYQINVNAEKIFGYSKGQLLQRKVNDIMPGVYAEYHDRILQNFQETNQSTMMNKQRHVWGKSKDGHLFQFSILIKPILNFYSQATTSEVYASIKRQVYIKEIVALVVDKNDLLRQVSSTAFKLFPFLEYFQQDSSLQEKRKKNIGNNTDLYSKNFSEFMIPIQDLLPDYEGMKQKILIDNLSHEVEVIREINEHHRGNSVFQQKIIFTVQMIEINIAIAGKIGYLIKMTKSSQSSYQRIPQEKIDCRLKLNKKYKKARASIQSVLRSGSVHSPASKSPLSMLAEENEQKELVDKLEESSKEKVKIISSRKKVDFEELAKQKIYYKLNEVNEVKDTSRKFIFSFSLFDKKQLFKNMIKNQRTSSINQDLPASNNGDLPAGNKGDLPAGNNGDLSDRSAGSLEPINQSFPKQKDDIQQEQGKMQNYIKKEHETLRYLGGHFKFNETLSKFFDASVDNFKQQLKSSQVEIGQRTNYAIGIRTKRLLENQIREMREEEEDLNNYGTNPEDKVEEEEQVINQHCIKPSELSTILEKQVKNEFITYLKIITVVLLLVSCGACIGEYLYQLNVQSSIVDGLNNLKQISQIQAEALYIRQFIKYLVLYSGSEIDTVYFTRQNFTEEINQLDKYLDYFNFTVSTDLKYKDNSTNRIFLGFALSKLVSQSNSIQIDPTTGMILAPEGSSNFFFIDYNMVNGIGSALQQQKIYLAQTVQDYRNSLTNGYIIFLVTVGVVFLVLIVMKNVLLKITLKKKTQILEVFFEIPRKSCGSIQKQCEKFILRLSVEDEEEMDLSDLEEEQKDDKPKKENKAQKKRQIIGEEKTTLSSICGTFGFILILMFFHVYLFASNQAHRKDMNQIFGLAEEIYELEPQFSTLSNYIVKI